MRCEVLARKLRSAAKPGADAGPLLELMGGGYKLKKASSCYSVEAVGQDWNYSCVHVRVETFHVNDGSLHIVEGVCSR